jgi:guanylate cyclase
MLEHAYQSASVSSKPFDPAILREPDLASNRSARLTRFLTIAGAALIVDTAAWTIVYLLTGGWLGVLVQASMLLLAIGVVMLGRHGRLRLSAHLLIWLCLGTVWSVVLLFEGSHPTLGRSVHVWFVAVLIGLHFVLLDASAWTRAAYATLCIASFTVVAVASPSIPAIAPAPEAFVRWAFPITIVTALVTSVLLLHLFVADIVDAEARLERANARLEDLLENMLPRAVAQRLRREGRTFADGYAQCSILFADIVGFTSLSERVAPDAIVAKLNAIFSCFDELAEARGLEKIKTIGDAYMIASGIPTPRADHATALADFALAAIDASSRFEGIRLRIGINSGPVVAGVIGRKRFLYDLWGDAVNVAERMEEYGVPDRIQITRVTRDLLGDEFVFEPRGPVHVRGHRDVEAFLLLGRRSASARGSGATAVG